MDAESDPARQLGVELVQLVKLLVALRARAPKWHPHAETAHYPLLFRLTDGPLRVSDLANCVHSDVSTVSRQVAALAAAGLVERGADPTDRRATTIHLTTSGREALEAIAVARGNWLRELMRDWSHEQSTALLDSLRHLTADLAAALRDPDLSPIEPAQSAASPESSP